jgi:phytoene dehydrogenase-like protein
MREPFSSYTPIKESLWSQSKAKSLFLGSNAKLNHEEISKFSKKDAEAFEKYEEEMNRFVQAVVALLDNRPPNLGGNSSSSFFAKIKSLQPLWKAGKSLRLKDIPRFHEIMTAPAARILDKWFETEPLKATLATDALIGTMSGPYTPGTG